MTCRFAYGFGVWGAKLGDRFRRVFGGCLAKAYFGIWMKTRACLFRFLTLRGIVGHCRLEISGRFGFFVRVLRWFW